MEKIMMICGRPLHALLICTTHPSITALRRKRDVDGCKHFLLLLRILAKDLLVVFSPKGLGTYFQLVCHRRTLPFNIPLLTRRNGVRLQRLVYQFLHLSLADFLISLPSTSIMLVVNAAVTGQFCSTTIVRRILSELNAVLEWQLRHRLHSLRRALINRKCPAPTNFTRMGPATFSTRSLLE
jgi:hypothetical protein